MTCFFVCWCFEPKLYDYKVNDTKRKAAEGAVLLETSCSKVLPAGRPLRSRSVDLWCVPTEIVVTLFPVLRACRGKLASNPFYYVRMSVEVGGGGGCEAGLQPLLTYIIQVM